MMRCPKCQGCLLVNHGDEHCINCGYRPMQPINPPLPSGPNPRRQWTPGTCQFCGKSAVRSKSICRACHARESVIRRHGTGLAAGQAMERRSA